MTTRRNFFKLTGTGALVTALTPASVLANDHQESAFPLNIAIAGYTFLKYKNDLDKVIEVTSAVGVNNISLKDFQLPYQSNQQEADQVVSKFASAGIKVYGLGVISMENEQQVDMAFNYAQAAHVKIIIGAPVYEVLPYLEKKAKENNIKVAIHNHGPEDKLFPDIDTIYEKIKGLNPLIGICLDIGHTFRCGHDPAAMLLKYKDRVFDMHVKDVDKPVEAGNTVINGRGKIDFPNLVKTMLKVRYSGMCSLEFEGAGDTALGVAESIGHFRGVIRCLK